MTGSAQSAGLVLAERLRLRIGDVESAIFARICELSRDALAGRDAQYIGGLRRTLKAMVDYALQSLTDANDPPTPLPTLVTVQARLAARNNVRFSTVSRRYMLGYNVLIDFIMGEASGEMDSDTVRRLVSPLSGRLHQVIDLAETAYEEELERLRRSPEQCRVHSAMRVLAGEVAEIEDCDYVIDGRWHLAVIATGWDANESVATLSAHLAMDLLPIDRGDGVLWAWLAGAEQPQRPAIEQALKILAGFEAPVALGEPGYALVGWQSSHHQAQAAFAVAQRRRERVACYFHVALEALVLANEEMARHLMSLYLGDLCALTKTAEEIRQALTAYYKSDHVTDAAAKTLGVERRTVHKRILKANEIVGYDVRARATEISVALRIFELLEARP